MDFDKDLEEKVEQLKDMKVKGLLTQGEFESMLEGLRVEVERHETPDTSAEKAEPEKALPEELDDISKKVEQLQDMFKRGMISREEYVDMKAEVLRK